MKKFKNFNELTERLGDIIGSRTDLYNIRENIIKLFHDYSYRTIEYKGIELPRYDGGDNYTCSLYFENGDGTHYTNNYILHIPSNSYNSTYNRFWPDLMK